MQDFKIKTLEKTSLSELTRCFNEGFSDYAIKFEVTEDYLRKRWHLARVDFGLSGGAFLDGKLVGMVIIAADSFQGIWKAHNAATCVAPAARRNGLTQRIFEFLIPKFHAKNIQHLQLEVLKGNTKAIVVYEKIGLKTDRELTYFTKAKTTQTTDNQLFNIQKTTSSDFQFDETKLPFSRTWEVNANALQFAPEAHDIYVARQENEIVGHIIITREMGWIAHIYVKPPHRKKGVGRAIINAISPNYDYLRACNIDTRNTAAVTFFEQVGFTQNVNQFEMKMELGNE